MPLQYYNRYSQFLNNGEQEVVPYINLPVKSTDKNYIYKVGQSRLDKISQQFYGTPFFGWLIMLSNPLAGSVEAEIPDNFRLRIPKPLVTTLQDYKKSVDLYKLYYGE